MKAMILSATLLVATITFSSFVLSHQASVNAVTVKAQSFNYLRVHRQGSGVALTWSVTASSAVQFKVERSYDGAYFDTVTELPNTGETTYKYADTSVYPGVIYYRITAVAADGSALESSSVESVRIVQHG